MKCQNLLSRKKHTHKKKKYIERFQNVIFSQHAIRTGRSLIGLNKIQQFDR